MLDSPFTTHRRAAPGSRTLLAAHHAANAAQDVALAADLWFGYDVHYQPHHVERTYGNWTPRYVGARNQVLGGLYFQQVLSLSSL